MTTTTILTVDKDPITILSYKTALLALEHQKITQFKKDNAVTINQALEKISVINPNFYDIIILNIKLPYSSNEKQISEDALGKIIKKISPNSKIIITSTFTDNYRLSNLLSSVNPIAFLIKDDITPNVLIDVLKSVLDETPYYTTTVQKLIRKKLSNSFYLDPINCQLIYELSKGTKMVDLPTIIPMSMGGIERRKRKIKTLFENPKMDDKTLLHIAEAKGFI